MEVEGIREGELEIPGKKPAWEKEHRAGSQRLIGDCMEIAKDGKEIG